MLMYVTSLTLYLYLPVSLSLYMPVYLFRSSLSVPFFVIKAHLLPLSITSSISLCQSSIRVSFSLQPTTYVSYYNHFSNICCQRSSTV